MVLFNCQEQTFQASNKDTTYTNFLFIFKNPLDTAAKCCAAGMDIMYLYFILLEVFLLQKNMFRSIGRSTRLLF